VVTAVCIVAEVRVNSPALAKLYRPVLGRLRCDSLDDLVTAFRWRAHTSVSGVHARLASLAAAGVTRDDAWNRCALELVAAARCVAVWSRWWWS
jgi:hypothetical protein